MSGSGRRRTNASRRRRLTRGFIGLSDTRFPFHRESIVATFAIVNDAPFADRDIGRVYIADGEMGANTKLAIEAFWKTTKWPPRVRLTR